MAVNIPLDYTYVLKIFRTATFYRDFMGIKSEKISMPMSNAGIMGFSSNTKLAGIEVNAKSVVLFVLLFVVIVKLAAYLIK